jgi:hypothetical protein
MNTRLEQDAADALQGHEDRQRRRTAERARWAMAQPVRIVGTWAPSMTAQQKKEHDQYVIDNRLPF